MPFPTLNKRLHHHKPYPSTWARVSAVLQKINSNIKAKSQCLKLQKENYHSASQKEAPCPPRKQIFILTPNSIWLVLKLIFFIIIIFNAAVFQLNYFL